MQPNKTLLDAKKFKTNTDTLHPGNIPKPAIIQAPTKQISTFVNSQAINQVSLRALQ